MGYKGAVGTGKSRRDLPAPSVKYSTRPNPLLILGLLSCLSASNCNQISMAAADSSPPDLETIIKGSNNAGAQKGDLAKPEPPASTEDLNQHPAASSVDELDEQLEKKLEDLESHFFGHIYRTEPAERRVVRLERFVFGTESGGPYLTRINHIASTLSVADPDGTKREIKLHRKEAPPQPVAQEQPQQQPTQEPQRQAQDTGEGGGNSIPNIVDSPEEHTVKTPLESATPVMPPRAPQVVMTPAAISAEMKQPPKMLVLQVSKGTFATTSNPGESIKELDVAIRVHPSDAELMFERAKVWIQMDKLSSALNDLSDAIMHDPNKSSYYLARAWCYKKLGNSYLAADDVKQARFVDPSLPLKIDLLQTSKNLVNDAAQ